MFSTHSGQIPPINPYCTVLRLHGAWVLSLFPIGESLQGLSPSAPYAICLILIKWTLRPPSFFSLSHFPWWYQLKESSNGEVINVLELWQEQEKEERNQRSDYAEQFTSYGLCGSDSGHIGFA